MSVINKLNDRIKSKITAATSDRLSAIRERGNSGEIRKSDIHKETGADMHGSTKVEEAVASMCL